MRRGVLIIVLLVYGCAPPARQDLAQKMTSVPISDCQAATGDEMWPPADFWQALGDPQLDLLIDLALQENPTLQQAAAKIQWGKQLAHQQKATLLPHLHLDADEHWQHFSKNGFVRSFYPPSPDIIVPAGTNQLDLTLNFEYEFDFWGKNRKKLQAALGFVQTLIAEEAEAKLTIATYLTEVYIELQASLAEQKLLEITRQDCLSRDQLNRRRAETGIDSAFPGFATEQQLYLINQLLAIKEQEIMLARHLIGLLIGKGPQGGDEICFQEGAYCLTERLPVPALVAIDLVAQRPDLQAQIWRIESASKEIGVARREFYPNINLCAFAGLESLKYADLLRGSSLMGGLVPAFHLPLFTGGRLTANLRAKEAYYNEMVFAYNEQLLHAAGEVADQLTILQQKQQEIQWQDQKVMLAKKSYQLEIRCFEAGIKTQLTVLNQEEALLSEQLTLIEKQKEYGFAAVGLIKALGGGYFGTKS